MTLMKSIDVQCDGDDCQLWAQGVTGLYATGSQARRAIAKRYGWVRKRVDGSLADLCPSCAAALSHKSESPS